MKTSVIFLLAIVLLLGYVVLQFIGSSKTDLTKVINDATLPITINAKDLPAGSSDSNYCYSVWFYINDWNVNYGKEKILFERKDSSNNVLPKVVLGAFENDLDVIVSYQPDHESDSDKKPTHECKITNIPLQKWVNLIVSLTTRSLDVYLDGKLVKTCVLPGVPLVNKDANIDLTPSPPGGFDGFTSKFQYIPNPVNPQEAYNIYKEGFGGGGLGGAMDRYKVKVSYLVDNKEKSSYEL